jgi:hypothetical protein
MKFCFAGTLNEVTTTYLSDLLNDYRLRGVDIELMQRKVRTWIPCPASSESLLATTPHKHQRNGELETR